MLQLDREQCRRTSFRSETIQSPFFECIAAKQMFGEESFGFDTEPTSS